VVEKGKNSVLPEKAPLAEKTNMSQGTPDKGPSPKTDALFRGLELLSAYNSIGLRKADEKSEINNYLAEALKRYPNRPGEALKLLAQEISKVDEFIDKYQGEQEALIQILLEINALNHWLPKTSLMRVSSRLGVPLTRIYHIASFYKAFSLVPQGRHLIQVCLGTACQVRGAPRLLDKVMNALKINSPGTDAEHNFTVSTVNCLGCCALGPVMMIDDEHYSNPSQEKIKQILASYS
jgi:NADH-quinone oxidoreductase subunit E